MNHTQDRSRRSARGKVSSGQAGLRIPLNTLAIPFGLIGYAGAWSAARTAFDWPSWTAEVFWLIAAVALIWMVIAHTIRGRRSDNTLLEQLKHPAQGPIAAIMPLSLVLIGAHYYTVVPVVSEILIYTAAVVGFAYAAWLTALWIRKTVPIEAIHGGYFLPTVAAGYITAGAAAAIGNHAVAVAAFGMGTFFWVVIFTIVVARLAFAAPLPGPLTPTLAILVAPPAVGGMAWLAINGRTLDWVTTILLGSTIFMLLMQVALLPTYRKLRFTLGFWAFTFSMAAVSSQIIALSDLARYPGWQVVVVATLIAVSGLIAVIAVKSLTAERTEPHAIRAEERQLVDADRAVEHP